MPLTIQVCGIAVALPPGRVDKLGTVHSSVFIVVAILCGVSLTGMALEKRITCNLEEIERSPRSNVAIVIITIRSRRRRRRRRQMRRRRRRRRRRKGENETKEKEEKRRRRMRRRTTTRKTVQLQLVLYYKLIRFSKRSSIELKLGALDKIKPQYLVGVSLYNGCTSSIR